MTIEIIAVGTELLMGQIVNTNAQYLSQRFNELGLDCYFQTVVGDNATRLGECLKIAAGRSDIILTTGGLGPTDDDLTKEVVCDFCGLKSVQDEKAFQNIKERFANSRVPLNNLKQAYMPEGCIVLHNTNGTAPGAIIEKEQKMYIILPGPPHEMREMFDKQVFGYLKQKSNAVLESKVLRIFGIGESELEEKLDSIIKIQTNPTVAMYAKQNEVTLRITAKKSTKAECIDAINRVEQKISEKVGRFIYAYGDDNSLANTVCQLLKLNKLKLSVAESCTGGLVASKITAVAGASQCFDCGLVVYSNQQKLTMLGVDGDILSQHGAVSEQVAMEMCSKVKNIAKADVGIGITGIAGPDGGTADKPVGLVYVAIATSVGAHCKRFNFGGAREDIQHKAAMFALDIVRRHCLSLA